MAQAEHDKRDPVKIKSNNSSIPCEKRTAGAKAPVVPFGVTAVTSSNEPRVSNVLQLSEYSFSYYCHFSPITSSGPFPKDLAQVSTVTILRSETRRIKYQRSRSAGIRTPHVLACAILVLVPIADSARKISHKFLRLRSRAQKPDGSCINDPDDFGAFGVKDRKSFCA